MNLPVVVKSFLIICCLFMQAKGQVILNMKEPRSLLIPTDEIGQFFCNARCEGFLCSGFWYINNEVHESWFNSQGMSSKMTHDQAFSVNENLNINIYTMTLTINTSEAMNNATIQCEFEASGIGTSHNRSATVNLFVISSQPILPNPFLTKNTTHLTLMWSPPFLWPGKRIQEYNVSLRNSGDGSIEYHTLSTSLTNPIVTLLIPIRSNFLQLNTQNMLSCITFSISPVDESGLEPMQTFNISDWAWAFLSDSEFTVLAINISVLFRASGAPAFVEVNVQLPETVCTFSELNYTLIIENKEGNIKEEVDTFPGVDSSVIKELIRLDLKENQEYSLKLRVQAQSQTVTSQKYIFSTHLLNDSSCNICDSPKTVMSYSALQYMLLSGIFGALTLVLLVAFLVMIVCLICIHHRKRRIEIKLNKSKNRVCNLMVHNPIYDGDGPVYESVQNQLEINNESESQSENARDRQYDNLRLSWSDTARYVDPPIHLQYLSMNAASNTSDSVNSPINKSDSVSMPLTAPRVMENGQERNKLHLTLSLDGKGFSDNHTSAVAPNSMSQVHAVVPADVDEPYTVMSPAGVH